MAVARVQKGFNSAAGSGSSLGVSLTGVGSASCVVCGVSFDTTNTFTSPGATIKDDLNVSSHNDVAFNDSGDGQELNVDSFKNYGGGNRTFTCTYSPAQILRSFEVIELSGADTGSPFIGSSTNTGSSGSLTSGNMSPAPSRNGSWALGISCVGTSTAATPTSPLTEMDNTTGNGDGTDYSDEAQSTAGNINAAWTVSPNATWGALVAGYQPPGTTTPVPKPGLSLSELRAHAKRLIQRLRIRGHKWFAFDGPTPFPPRNTTTTAKGAQPINTLVMGRRLGERLRQRAIASWGHALTQWRPPHPTPLTNPKAPIAMALGRRQGERLQQRKTASWGRVTVWQRPVRSSPSVNPLPQVVSLLSPPAATREMIARRQSEVFYFTQLLIVQSPNTPKLPGASGIVTRRLRPRRVRRRPVVLHRQLAVFPPPPTPVLPGIPRSMVSTARTRQARRVHIRHNQSRVLAKRGLPVKPFVPPVTTTRRMWMGHRAHRAEIILPTPVDIA